MGALWSWLLPGYTTELYTCVSMPDIWCSFNAFVDYDVYFDENETSKLEIRHFGKTNTYIMTIQKCKLCFPQTGANRDRQTNRQTDRQKHKERQAENRDRERHKKTDRQANRERESKSLGKSLLCHRIIILKQEDKLFYANSLVWKSFTNYFFFKSILTRKRDCI